MKRLLLILLSINLFTLAFGQSLTVKGKVSSTDGELLPGVNVKVKDATIGTITDFDGNYQLQVKYLSSLMLASKSMKLKSMLSVI